MPTTLSAVEAAAMALTDDERAVLAISLIASIRPPAPSLHPAWEAELARRTADLDAGRTKTLPGPQVLAELRDILESHPNPIEAFGSILREGET
jgi:putative addiction module component (TIGR02574 family)